MSATRSASPKGCPRTRLSFALDRLTAQARSAAPALKQTTQWRAKRGRALTLNFEVFLL